MPSNALHAEGRRRMTWVAGAVLAVLVVTLASALGAFVAVSSAGPSNSPARPTGSGANAIAALHANDAILTSPLYKAAVEKQLNAFLNQPYVAREPNVARSVVATAASIEQETPSQLLNSRGVGSALSIATTVSDALALSPALAPASWQDYLYAAGVGCLAGVGGAALLGGGVGLGVSSYETVTVASAVVGGGETVATDSTPVGFLIGCAIGAIANVLIFSNILDEQPQVNYNGLLANFEQLTWTAYTNYLNLTATMYASLASLLVYAQVGFARAADNAALLQIQNQTFNVGIDLLDSGLAVELGTMPTTMEYQFAQDFYTLPQLLDGFAAPGSFYGDRGCMPITTPGGGSAFCGTNPGFPVAPSTGIYFNGTSPGHGSPWNATYAGFSLGGYATGGFLVKHVGSVNGIIIPNPSNAMLIAPADGVSALSYHFTSPTTNGTPQAWVNNSANGADEPVIPLMPASECAWVWGANYATKGLPLRQPNGSYDITPSSGCPLPPGVYNITGSGSSEYGGLIIPMASQVPTLSSLNIGSFNWAIRYFQSANAVVSSAGGSCHSTVTGGSDIDVGTAFGWLLNGNTIPALRTAGPSDLRGVQFGVASEMGSCAFGNGNGQAATSFVREDWVTAQSNGLAPYDPQTQLSSTIAGVEVNATNSAQAYWSFLHINLGYTSLSQIPPNCIIPAPYMSIPSSVNLGALSLNETEILYQAFLRGMGNFYGANVAFSVCHGKIQAPYTWFNLTLVNFSTVAFGGVYLNNGTSTINVAGKHLVSESLTNSSTWAIAACETAVGSAQPAFPAFPSPCPNGQFTANPGSIVVHKVVGGFGDYANNATLIPVPLIKSATVTVGSIWPVPHANPIELFYATRNSMLGNQTSATGGGNWSLLSTVLLSGNGTTSGIDNTYGVARPGDALYLTECQVAGIKTSGSCAFNLSSFAVYIASIICPTGTNMTVAQNGSAVCVNVSPPVVNPNSGGGGCYGAGVPIFGEMESWFASAIGLGGLGCAVAFFITAIIFLALVVLVIWAIVALVRPKE